MASTTVQQVIKEWQTLDTRAADTMNLYQQVANHFFVRENNITTQRTPGEDKSLPIIDPTGIDAFQKMCSGLFAFIFPTGQYFCKLAPEDPSLTSNESAMVYLNKLTDVLHQELYRPSCNFLLEMAETITSWAGFGTCNTYSEWSWNKNGLNFKDWDVANYRFGVDADGMPNRCLIRWQYTAKQAVELYGDYAGPNCVRYASEDNPEKWDEKFWFIIRTAPNKMRNTSLQDNVNYEYEKVVINETEKVEVQRSGYREFPHHIARWLTASHELWGYGQGCYALSADKEMQVKKRQFNLCAELHNNPPRQTLDTFQGTPKVYPGANNIVSDMNTIASLDGNLKGNFPISKDDILMQRQMLKDLFYAHVFAPLDERAGDRMTQIEIIERVNAGQMQLILPITRFYNEHLTPLVERCVRLIMRNKTFTQNGMRYKIPAPPPELQGFKVEYLGRLALALKEQKTQALRRFSEFSMQMEQVFPNFTSDNINPDRAGRQVATVFGVDEMALNTPEEKAAIRQKRQLEMDQIKQMQAMQAASKTYKDASKGAEENSPAAAMMENMQ